LVLILWGYHLIINHAKFVIFWSKFGLILDYGEVQTGSALTPQTGQAGSSSPDGHGHYATGLADPSGRQQATVGQPGLQAPSLQAATGQNWLSRPGSGPAKATLAAAVASPFSVLWKGQK
jgi:hypothetical protein